MRSPTLAPAMLLLVGCAEVSTPPASAETCVWRGGEPVVVSAPEAGMLEFVVSRDGQSVAMVVSHGNGTWVSRWRWGANPTEWELLSPHRSVAIGGGPSDDMGAIVHDAARGYIHVEELGTTAALHLDSDIRGVHFGALSPLHDGAGRTLLLNLGLEASAHAVRLDPAVTGWYPLGCDFGHTDLHFGQESLAVVPAFHPLEACAARHHDAEQMLEVVSLQDGRDVRHVVPRRDVPFVHLEHVRLVSHDEGISLMWVDAAACGIYCFAEPNDYTVWFQPLDFAGRAAGSQRELSMGAWGFAVAGGGAWTFLLERGDKDHIHFIDREGNVQRRLPTAGKRADVVYGTPDLAALAATPSGDALVAAWARDPESVLVQTFTCTDP